MMDDVSLLRFVRKARRLTAADLALGTGTSLEEAERALSALMCDAGGDFAIRGDGDAAVVQYEFPSDFERRARVRRWKWRLASEVEVATAMVSATLKASAGLVLVASVGVALVASALACLASQHTRGRRRRALALPTVGVLVRDWNDAAMVYWLFGGRNPFFRPLFFWGPQRLCLRRTQASRRRRQQQRWTACNRDDSEQSPPGGAAAVNVREELKEEEAASKEEEEPEPPSTLTRVTLAMYGFLFGGDDDDDDDVVESPWRLVTRAIRRRKFVVVPEDLASWLPDPPSTLAGANAACAASVGRFGGKLAAVPDGAGFVIDFRRLALGSSSSSLPRDDFDDFTALAAAAKGEDYLEEPLRRLFPKATTRDDLVACAGAVGANLLLWACLRFAVLPGLASRRRVSENKSTTLALPTTSPSDLLLWLLTSRVAFAVASFFLTFAILFCLLPCARYLLFVAAPNYAIARRNARRAKLREGLRNLLLDAAPDAPIRRKYAAVLKLLR